MRGLKSATSFWMLLTISFRLLGYLVGSSIVMRAGMHSSARLSVALGFACLLDGLNIPLTVTRLHAQRQKS